MCSKPIFCSKIALKGKTCSRLLKPQKVAPNAKSCSKVAEHNRDRPIPNLLNVWLAPNTYPGSDACTDVAIGLDRVSRV